jgi:hypothetical protein
VRTRLNDLASQLILHHRSGQHCPNDQHSVVPAVVQVCVAMSAYHYVKFFPYDYRPIYNGYMKVRLMRHIRQPAS